MSGRTNLLQKIITRDQYQFWALNLFGWSGYGFFITLGALLWNENLTVQLAYAAAATVSGFIFSLIMRIYYLRLWDKPPIKRFFLSLLVVIVISGIWSYLKMDTYYMMMEYIFSKAGQDKEMKTGFGAFFNWYTYSFFIFLSWAALYYGIKYSKMLQQEKQKRLKATAMAHEAQLKMLRYQLNPHFLFNTLNAISTLILIEQNKTANTMVVELSKFLRHSLENHPSHKVDLIQEIDTLKLYLNIEKVRFEERLKLDISLDKKSEKALVPSLILQPLIENSIKYAVSKCETGGTITIKSKVFADQLLIEVEDDGPGIVLEEGKLPKFDGVGLRNLTERLHELYGINHDCKFSNVEPHGLKISIRLPYEISA